MRRWTMGCGAGVALAALLASPGGWSQNNDNAANGAQQAASAAQPATRQIVMVPATAELQKGLNAKKLKPGEAVTAKLEQTVNLPNEPALKRDTVLVGHVDAVQASEHHGDSSLTVTFDQAKMKDGTVLPVKVTVMRVAAPAMAQYDPQTGGPADAGGGAAPEATPAGGGERPGGGGNAGMQSQPQQPQPMNTEPPTQGAAATSAQNGVPGVMLKSDIHQKTSATFLSTGRNVDVPDGTQMQVAIAYIPKGVQVH